MNRLTATQRQQLIKRVCLAPHISNTDIDAINAAFDEQDAVLARLARAEQLLLDEGMAIDRYETDGSLVYENDDYVVDGDGCYLPRADYEAFAALDSEATPSPAQPAHSGPTPGAAGGAVDA